MRSHSGHGWIHVTRAARRGIVFGLMLSAWTLAGVARGQSISEEFPVPTAGASPSMIVAGPDGNLWFTESTRSQIGQITPNGVVTEFPTSRSATAITVGSDHNLWFTQGFSASIGRMTTHGDDRARSAFRHPPDTGLFGITSRPGRRPLVHGVQCRQDRADHDERSDHESSPSRAPLPGNPNTSTSRWPMDIVAGPDGNLWFTETFANLIGRITPQGAIQEFVIPTADCPTTSRSSLERKQLRPVGHHGRPGRRPLVPEGQCQQGRPDHDLRGGYRVSHPHIFCRALWNHLRPRRKSLVHGERDQQDRADHARRRDPGVRDPDRFFRAQGNHDRPRRLPLVCGGSGKQDRPDDRFHRALRCQLDDALPQGRTLQN